MPLLRHEALGFEGIHRGTSFGLATLEGRATLEKIDGPARILYLEYAATYEAAMQAHHDRQGWGRYKPMPGITDRPYEQEELERQLVEYPDDTELRRLNGLPG